MSYTSNVFLGINISLYVSFYYSISFSYFTCIHCHSTSRFISVSEPLWILSDSGIGFSAHLSSPLIFSYIGTYILSFSIYDSRVSSSHRQHGIRAIISSRRRRHRTLQSSFSARRLFLLRCNILSFLVYRHHHYRAFSLLKPRAMSVASLHPTLRDVCRYAPSFAPRPLCSAACRCSTLQALRSVRRSAAARRSVSSVASLRTTHLFTPTSSISSYSSAPSSDTSLPHIPAPQVDTQVTLPPVVLPTLPAFAPRLSITAQLTRPANNFTGNNYFAWASGFELFLESHNLHHHLMEDPPPLRDPSYASWSQSDSTIITWMLHSIEQNITESLARINPVRSLWQTLETIYANQTNIGHVVEIFETLLTLKQGDLSLQAHFGCMQALIQEVDLYQPPTTDLVTLKHYRAELYAGIYLSGLRPSIASQLRGSLLSVDHVPGITTIFSAAL